MQYRCAFSLLLFEECYLLLERLCLLLDHSGGVHVVSPVQGSLDSAPFNKVARLFHLGIYLSSRGAFSVAVSVASAEVAFFVLVDGLPGIANGEVGNLCIIEMLVKRSDAHVMSEVSCEIHTVLVEDVHLVM